LLVLYVFKAYASDFDIFTLWPIHYFTVYPGFDLPAGGFRPRVVDSKSTINLRTNIQLNNSKPLYTLFGHLPASVFQIYWLALKQTNVT